MGVVGSTVSIRTDSLTVEPRFPATSHEVYRNEVVAETLKDPAYSVDVALVAGSVPSVVYVVRATPEPPVSLADSATLTGADLNHPPQDPPPQVAAVVGAAPSTRTGWAWSGSTLPAWSVEAKRTVEVVERLNGPL
jgi:hypothetical protein